MERERLTELDEKFDETFDDLVNSQLIFHTNLCD